MEYAADRSPQPAGRRRCSMAFTWTPDELSFVHFCINSTWWYTDQTEQHAVRGDDDGGGWVAKGKLQFNAREKRHGSS